MIPQFCKRPHLFGNGVLQFLQVVQLIMFTIAHSTALQLQQTHSFCILHTPTRICNPQSFCHCHIGDTFLPSAAHNSAFAHHTMQKHPGTNFKRGQKHGRILRPLILVSRMNTLLFESVAELNVSHTGLSKVHKFLLIRLINEGLFFKLRPNGACSGCSAPSVTIGSPSELGAWLSVPLTPSLIPPFCSLPTGDDTTEFPAALSPAALPATPGTLPKGAWGETPTGDGTIG